jgi:hypothetical protein
MRQMTKCPRSFARCAGARLGGSVAGTRHGWGKLNFGAPARETAMPDHRPEIRPEEPIGSRKTQAPLPSASWGLIGVGVFFVFVLVMLFTFARDTTRTPVSTGTTPPATTGQAPR